MTVRRVRRKPRTTVTLVCSRCGKRHGVSRFALSSRAKTRCPACGGPLNKPSQA